jgi:hypothetical protein
MLRILGNPPIWGIWEIKHWMGCVNMHWKICTIEGWGSPNCVWNTMEKIGEDNWKVRKTNWIVNQMPTFGPKNDKIWTWWALDVSLKNMLERVWWCKCSEMESWSQTICCQMHYSNRGKHAWTKGGRRSHVALRCCWKGKVLFLVSVKVVRKKRPWSTINLATMIKLQGPNSLNRLIRAMVVVNMSSMPPKVIGKETYL